MLVSLYQISKVEVSVWIFSSVLYGVAVAFFRFLTKKSSLRTMRTTKVGYFK